MPLPNWTPKYYGKPSKDKKKIELKIYPHKVGLYKTKKEALKKAKTLKQFNGKQIPYKIFKMKTGYKLNKIFWGV